ncbi:GNAT family N-acetyltransferase [Endozoicomonas sp. 8E]|uniref:GNAT family N-acetyltransferase n=1 Tax=Endozoicomonas sp. 8E TaxID=3035692 RepID=UPI002938E034|nr:GNAT family N-acetyltransferase [Endozoicomonas sp. 8E]WOG27529.1 GNAT family N-acetyltransferase [Endozoicomonas sp. 8E]
MLIVAETPRLILRTWQEADLKPYADIIGAVHKELHYSTHSPANEAETDLWRFQIELDHKGWSRWAVVLKESNRLIGNCGFSAYGDTIEMSWRFSQEYRGRGLVIEAAEAVTDLGFKRLGFKEIISFASPENEFAIDVIESLGMSLAGYEGWCNLTVARFSLSSVEALSHSH